MIWRAPVASGVLAMSALVLAGCPDQQGKGLADAGVVSRGPAPEYAEAAARYNVRIESLGRFRAQVTMQFRYTDRKGNERIEQPEGTIQIVRPDHLALSLGKLGQVKFWLGSDAERYWWLDMMDEPVAYVGRHGSFSDRAAKRLGVSIPPRSLIRVLCLTPIDERAWGATQWSADGERLGITTMLADEAEDGRGRQRVWVDPATYRPIKIELFDAGGSAVVVAHMEGDERVEVAAGTTRGGAPWIPKSITIHSKGTDASIRLSLSSARNEGVNDKAFNFDEVVATYGVEEIVDLDAGEGNGPG